METGDENLQTHHLALLGVKGLSDTFIPDTLMLVCTQIFNRCM